MRTTQAAATNVANGENDRPVYYDALFRDTKNRIVAPPEFPPGAHFVDTHAHLDMLHHPELALARCALHRVDYVVTVTDPTEEPEYTLENLEGWLAQAAELAQCFEQEEASSSSLPSSLPSSPSPSTLPPPSTPRALPTVRHMVGCHPHNASRYDEKIESILLDALKDERTVALGEIGLDYHYDHSPRAVQKKVYRRQLELAHELSLPVSLHMREAHDEGLQILTELGLPPAGALLHCFNLDYATLEPFLELGCSVAFGGPLTFKKCDDVRDAARRTPPDRIVTETDAPFMAPHPVRGVTCGPEHVVYTAARLAEVFAEAENKAFYDQVYQNAFKFFERPLSEERRAKQR